MIYNFEKDRFLDLMKNKIYHLPKRWGNGDFQNELKKLFGQYTKATSIIVNSDEQKEIVRVCDLVLRAVDHYYNGYSSNAFRTFSTAMDLLMKRPFMIYQKSGEIIKMKDYQELKLFRVRNVLENKIYHRRDIFHTPFFLRSKVATCRYSIAGYPCLYLATNLDLCIYETPKSDGKQLTMASRFEIIRNYEDNPNDLKVIEMGVKPQHFLGPSEDDKFHNDIERTIDRLSEIDLSSEDVMNNYLLWYPVIAASSFIRISKDDPFASEYIVPQLIMEWIRLSSKKKEYFGIRYFSCATERASEIGMNYVFPTHYNNSSGSEFCEILSSSFNLTAPVMLHNFSAEFICQNYLERDFDLDKVIK